MTMEVAQMQVHPLVHQIEADLSDVEAFQRNVTDLITQLQTAITRGEDETKRANALSERGGWKVLVGSLTGNNDKDLAGMVKGLGGSLFTTQSVLQILLQLQTRKDGILRDFHAALVDKVVALQRDNTFLDTNQREVALLIISDLRDHVARQLEQQNAVARQERQLASLLEHEREAVSRLDALTEHGKRIEEAQARQQQAIQELGQRLAVLEKACCARPAFAQRLRQQAVSGFAMLVAIAALASTLLH